MARRPGNVERATDCNRVPLDGSPEVHNRAKLDAAIAQLLTICHERQQRREWGRLELEALWEDGVIRRWRIINESITIDA